MAKSTPREMAKLHLAVGTTAAVLAIALPRRARGAGALRKHVYFTREAAGGGRGVGGGGGGN